jgi:hypothetical protein
MSVDRTNIVLKRHAPEKVEQVHRMRREMTPEEALL